MAFRPRLLGQLSLTAFKGLLVSIIFTSGIINITSSLFAFSWQRFALLGQLLPLSFSYSSRSITFVIGIFLILLAGGLWQRKERAWFMSLILLIISFFLHLAKGLDFEESLIIFISIALLIAGRPVFSVPSGKINIWSLLKTIGVALLLLIFFSYLGIILRNYNSGFFGRHSALWIEDAIMLFSSISVLLIFSAIFAPLVGDNRLTDDERLRLQKFILRFGSDPLDYYGLLEDKQYFFNDNHSGVVIYKIKNNVAVVLGSPIVDDESKLSALLDNFRQYLIVHGLTGAYYQVNENELAIYEKYGYKSMKIAEEAIINLTTFSLDGAKMAEVRHCVNRMKRLHVRFNWYRLHEVPWQALSEIVGLHEQWQKAKRVPQLTFSMNYFPFPIEKEGHVLIVRDSAERVLAVLSFLPFANTQGVSLDLMMRAEIAPNSTMEAAIAEACRHFKILGYRELSLGAAPLSDVEIERQTNILEKGVRLIYENARFFYGYRTLFKFKDKFVPEWQHKYLVFASYAKLPQVGLALLQAHLKDDRQKLF